MKQIFTTLLVFTCSWLFAQQIYDLELLNPGQDTFNNGINLQEAGFSTDALFFPNSYVTDFGGYWAAGWAVSSSQDSVTGDFTNLYGAIPASGNRQSATYLMGQQNAKIHLSGVAATEPLLGLYVTNSTYAYRSMLNGDDFAKQFGGTDGTDPDFFLLTVKAYREGQLQADSVDVYLADFRADNSEEDYILKDWTFIDLRTLGTADSLVFQLRSSDNGEYGMNTPAFFAVDDIITNYPGAGESYVVDFETPFLGLEQFYNGLDQAGSFSSGAAVFPSVYVTDFGGYWAAGWAQSAVRDNLTAGFGNLYSAITGEGVDGSLQYAVGQQGSIIRLTGQAAGKAVQSVAITNSTYAYYSMLEGDDFAKKFGGENGTDPDFFKLTVKKYLNGTLGADSVDVYLADFRSDKPEEDFIVDAWKSVDLSILGPADSLLFSLSSSDNGTYGMNTPAFFCIDNLVTFDPASEAAVASDSPLILNWASGCTVERGFQNIALPDSGYVDAGLPEMAIGAAGTNGVVSLGDAGTATLTFEYPIMDGAGADFAVFENGFPSGNAYFLELAFVEVSSDGEQFFRFPAVSSTPTEEQLGTFGLLRPEDLSNLAGKFPGRQGTPFDLAELAGTDGLNINAVTHVRIVDVVGSLNDAYASLDANGNKINDPWPTAFASGGFDLDAVGVLHENRTTSTVQPVAANWSLAPNPASDVLQLNIPDLNGTKQLLIRDALGRVVRTQSFTNNSLNIPVAELQSGTYFLSIVHENQLSTRSFIKIN